MTPSYSAPKLTRPQYPTLATPFSADLVVDEHTMNSEIREVHAGMRATFSSHNATLRAQGAAIRGLEELMKRALPEVDRLTKTDKQKADSNSVDRVVSEVRARCARGKRCPRR